MDITKIAACSKASCGAAKCAEGKEKIRQRIRSLKADKPVKDQEQTKTANERAAQLNDKITKNSVECMNRLGKKASLDCRYLYGMPKRASERKAEFKSKLSMYFKEVSGN